MSFQQKILGGVIWTTLQNWGSQFGSLLIFFILARLLGPEDFGLVALANIFLAFTQVFLNQGFPQALIQRESLEPEHINAAFWSNLASGVGLTAIGIAIAPLVALLFKQPDLTPVVRCFSLLLLINSVTDVQQALLERQFKFKFVALRSLLGLFIGGLVGVAMAFSGAGVWSLVAQQLTYELVGAIVLWQASSWRPQWQFSWPHFRHLFNFGINILAFNFLGFINTRADDLLIGYFLGPTALGYYSIAYRILTIMVQLLVDISNRVALPTFSRLQGDMNKFRQTFYTATRLTSLVAFPCFLGVAALAPKIIPLLFGEQWIPAVPVLQLLAVAGIFRTVSRFKGAVFMALGKPVWRVWLGLLNSVLNVVLFAIAVRWGIVAVAAAYLLRCGLVFPIEQGILSWMMQASMKEYLRQFMAPLASALIMVAAVGLSQQLMGYTGLLSALQLAIGIAVGMLVYPLLIWLLAPSLFQQLWSLLQSVWRQPKQKSS